jgi:glucose/mannose-6-phosphate isomerase
MRKLDPSDMMGKVLGLPAQFLDARQRARQSSTLRSGLKGIRQVLVAGLGGSAIGGDLLKGLTWKTAPFSLSVNRHYDLPGWAGRDTLVVCSSYSGNTEETLSVFHQALKARLPLLVISTGGELLKLAQKHGLSYLAPPGGLPPRSALGYSFITLLTAMESLGLLSSQEQAFDETLEWMTRLAVSCGPLSPVKKNLAKRLALFLHGKLPVIYAGQDHLESVGLRWKCQINENSKQVCLNSVIPEMNHNEVLGYSFPEPLTKGSAVILLRQPKGDHPQIARRFAILKGILKSRTAGVVEALPQGKSLLCQMMTLVYLGDFLSVYLAYLKGVDPTPIVLIDQFKKSLAGKA